MCQNICTFLLYLCVKISDLAFQGAAEIFQYLTSALEYRYAWLYTSVKFSILYYDFSVLSELLLPMNSLVEHFWTSTTTARRLCNTGGLPVTKGNVQASRSRYRWNIKLLFLLCFMILQGCLLFPSGVSNFPLGMYSPGSVLYSYSIYFYLQLPKKQFRYASEFTSRAELEALALDLDSLRLQSLIICERILGTQHKVSILN